MRVSRHGNGSLPCDGERIYMKWKTLKRMYRLGGLRLLANEAERKLGLSNKSQDEVLYKIQKAADPKDYPQLLKDWFTFHTGQPLHLDHPYTYNEKIQWMKLYDSTPLKTKLADKYLVREYVKETVGEKYLVKLYGVWDSFDEIDFDALPDQFVLKTNHGTGTTVVVRDKKSLDIDALRKKMNDYLSHNYAYMCGLELQYRDIPPKIMAEEYLEEISENGPDLLDYKVHCFDGKAKYFQIIGNRSFADHSANIIMLDLDWKPVDLQYFPNFEPYKVPPKRPDNYREMIEVAEKLSKGFSYVRVDLYDINGRILLGEMTFTPASGLFTWSNEAANRLLGDMIHLPTDDSN